MAFIKTLIFSLFAVAAVAVPTSEGAPKQGGSAEGNVCGNGQKEACCDTSSGDSLIAGLNCLSVPVLAIPIQQACGSNVAACCPSSADGVLNVQANCAQIPL